jgi:hydrogenase 3 maturation protease
LNPPADDCIVAPDFSLLDRLLENIAETNGDSTGCEIRVAVVGIGQELRGDDGAGPHFIHRLRKIQQDNLSGQASPVPGISKISLKLWDAGPAPENFTGALRQFAPHLVLLVDAAEWGTVPGSIRCISWRETDWQVSSTHSLPLPVLADYLERETGCHVVLVCVQAGSLEFGATLSPRLAQCLDEAASIVATKLLLMN